MAIKKYKSVKEAKGFQIGEKIKSFVGKDINGNNYSLEKALTSGKVILIFSRGHWCPFCNKHIKHIQSKLPLIYEKGASVVVITPEKSEFIRKTIEKTGAEFTILYDENNKISDAFDVTFRPSKIERIMYNTVLGAKLKESHTDESEQLPIPATFIIGQDHTVLWRHFDPNYRNRSKVEDIIKNL